MAQMFNPPHPGSILREDVLPALEITVTDAADQLGVSRVALSRVINEHAGISADMALRLGKWLGNGPEVWVRMQSAHDLWHAKLALSKELATIRKAKVPRRTRNDERDALAA